ncbi:hypothetical protein FRX31_019165 [Thalictrum thalictroides]|uniref:Uncharacterized protein n=1 Tax=Thalictrum thalictroides TaxID=46969 RepID=A0A7J6W376_THATH|nr:hypothetical protein FRX31_019165 [Thalictrum thalictroides]
MGGVGKNYAIYWNQLTAESVEETLYYFFSPLFSLHNPTLIKTVTTSSELRSVDEDAGERIMGGKDHLSVANLMKF